MRHPNFVIIEVAILLAMFFFGVHWAMLILTTTFVVIDIWPHVGYSNRQKHRIAEIEITGDSISCAHLNGQRTTVPIENSLFSIGENRLEGERIEIEIREKRLLRSKLIGTFCVRNWDAIIDIKEALGKNGITPIKYQPEGF